MVKPRLIILIRHAQSEGNKNREIHQMIPDHRVKLTEEGHKQAEEAGRRLRALLKPDDTLQIYTSPYRRTRETTEGILKTLTARDDPDDPTAAPSPFSRNKIKVYEEPRIREQDFGNFQPCSAEMERMWQERADYGHFFYRIPDGESAADAYDRISGFNESLWRQFSEDEFPSVCVLVTHGLMTRVFLMKWYHWSVEYFEDLRNINHCEFITMHKDERGKYMLQNKMRTWSELKRQKREAEAKADPQRRNTLSHFLKSKQDSPSIPPRKWGGCKDGCNHQNEKFPRRAGQHQQRKQTQELTLPSPLEAPKAETEDTPMAHVEPGTETVKTSSSRSTAPQIDTPSPKPAIPEYLQPGRDGGGLSGVNTPHESSETEGATGYFETSSRGGSLAEAIRKGPQRKATPDDIERWAKESGMNAHRRADPLGDEAAEDTEGSGDVDVAEREERSVRESVY